MTQFGSFVGYFGVWRPIILGYLAFQVETVRSVDQNKRLLSIKYGTLWGRVASYLGLLGFPIL